MIKKGRGMSCNIHPTGLGGSGDPDQAMIKLKPDGTVDLIVGACDIGQGCKNVVWQIAAEELEIPLDKITVVNDNTGTGGVSTGTLASRVTFNAGNAVIAAARDFKKKILKIAAINFNTGEEDLEIRGGKVYKKSNPDESVDFATLAGLATWVLGEFVVGHGGYIFAPHQSFDPETGAINAFEAMAYGATVVDVEVDTETGVVEVKKVYVTFDVGKAINPEMVKGQILGGVSMGIGFSITEDLAPYYPSMEFRPGSFTDYIIPTTVDMPEIKYSIVEMPDPDGPYGAKGFSEMTLSPFAPAIVSAIHNATGVWIHSLPLTPEKVLRALEEDKKDSKFL